MLSHFFKGKSRKGCGDNCYLHWETHSLGNVPFGNQKDAEGEVDKLKKDEELDIQMLGKVIHRTCLARLIKEGDGLREHCRYHELVHDDDMSVPDRLAIYRERIGKRYNNAIITLGILSTCSVILNLILGYLNFFKE